MTLTVSRQMVEFAYPYSGSYTSGSGFWTTPTGQQQCTYALVQLMKGYSHGAGVIYWGTTYVTGSWGSESLFGSESLHGVLQPWK